MKEYKKFGLMAVAFIAGLLIVSQANAQSGSRGAVGGSIQSSFSPGGFSQPSFSQPVFAQQSFAQPAFRAPVQSSFQSFNSFPSQSFARPVTSFRSPSFNTFSQPRFIPQQSFRPTFNSFGSSFSRGGGGCSGGKCFR